jgi:hypothetical protein
MVFDLKEDSAHSVSIENGVNTFGLKFDGSEG